jgi:hypothetical protein
MCWKSAKSQSNLCIIIDARASAFWGPRSHSPIRMLSHHIHLLVGMSAKGVRCLREARLVYELPPCDLNWCSGNGQVAQEIEESTVT